MSVRVRGNDSFALADRFTRLRKIASEAAGAQSVGEIAALERELNGMFDELVEKLARGGLNESEISTALFVFKHVSDTLGEHRHMLIAAPPSMATAGRPGET